MKKSEVIVFFREMPKNRKYWGKVLHLGIFAHYSRLISHWLCRMGNRVYCDLIGISACSRRCFASDQQLFFQAMDRIFLFFSDGPLLHNCWALLHLQTRPKRRGTDPAYRRTFIDWRFVSVCERSISPVRLLGSDHLQRTDLHCFRTPYSHRMAQLKLLGDRSFYRSRFASCRLGRVLLSLAARRS